MDSLPYYQLDILTERPIIEDKVQQSNREICRENKLNFRNKLTNKNRNFHHSKIKRNNRLKQNNNSKNNRTLMTIIKKKL
jgi:hypothetical protein